MRFLDTLDAQTVTAISSGETLTDSRLIALREQMLSLQVSVSYGLSLFHTMFNICNVCIMIWFTKIYVRICTKLVKSPPQTEEDFLQLKYITAGLLSTSELSLMQAKKEMLVYGERTYRMLEMVKDALNEKDDEKFLAIFDRVKKYEEISDRMEIEIANYLTRVLEGRLSAKGKNNVRVMLRAVSEIESIGDSCYNMARTIKRRNEAKVVFTDEQNHNVEHMLTLVDEALTQMNTAMPKNVISHDDMMRTNNLENQINSYRNMLKVKHIDSLDDKKYKYSDAVYYMDLISECEKAGDYIVNVIEALEDTEILS